MDVKLKKGFTTISRFLVAICSCLFLITSSGCEENPDGGGIIPYAFVDLSLNLNKFELLPLKTIGGYVQIDGGVRGIIIYRESNTHYRAFERNCTYEPLNDCARVEVDQSGLFMIDPCCNSSFDFQGFPTGGPASISLKEYRTFVNGNFLEITND
ncbi:hypothetical protein QQ008_21760 [Fulvivirgaceae bacterium BMA10]|uniref:Rieske domain-containing protein n=1 Tax=Splendidivirga corallicola TaxID=3051826 RepID=A0ABT8KWP5_9BACT|nr:hypothetical protein [Fulvivirgaceae bacterium BMA10]